MSAWFLDIVNCQLVLCLCMAYNSGIILTTIVTYYSQNYAGILGASPFMVKL